MPSPTFTIEVIEQPRAWRVRTAEGGILTFVSEAELEAFVTRRTTVTWTRSLPASHPLQDDLAFASASRLLAFAQRTNLFPDRNGNCSWRGSRPHTLVVTPRQVEKAQCLPEHLIIAEHHPAERLILYSGNHKPSPDHKPSIDTSVQATLYDRFPNISGLLHVHSEAGLFLPDVGTVFPYPCGVQEEAREVVEALARAQAESTPLTIELVHHGYLIGLGAADLARLEKEWDDAADTYKIHLAEIGHTDTVPRLTLQSIFARGHIVGVLATDRAENWSSCFLQPAYRNGGLGRQLLPLLARRGVPIRAHDLCAVTNFYCSHGWKIISRDGKTVLLTPE